MKYEPGGYPPTRPKNPHARWLLEAARISIKAGLINIAHTCEQAAEEITKLAKQSDARAYAAKLETAIRAVIDDQLDRVSPGVRQELLEALAENFAADGQVKQGD